MFSRLIIKTTEGDIEFHSHELVRVLQHLAPSETGVEPRVPLYSSYEESIIEGFKAFSDTMISQYAGLYGVDPRKLGFFLKFFYTSNVNGLLTSGMFSEYNALMHRIGLKPKPAAPLIDEAVFNRLILPPHVPPSRAIAQWIGFASYAKTTEELIKKGWWLHLGGRVILLRNSPTGRDHLYVSDHGASADVIDAVKRNSIDPGTEGGRSRIQHCISFMKYYNEKLSPAERGYVKEHFILWLIQGRGGDPSQNEFLLHVLGLPESCRERTLRNGRLDFPGFNMSTSIGNRDRADSPWIKPLGAAATATVAAIAADNLIKYAEIFDATLERVRYLGNIQGATFITKLFSGGLSPYFTQIDQIFNTVDATRFKIFFVLSEIAKELGKGLQNFLLRPPHSFGSSEKGESYSGFAKAIEAYEQSPASLPKQRLASVMRLALKGSSLSDSRLYFIPNLTAAWFVSESARYKPCFASGLMLLDLIGSGIMFIDSDGNDLYSWKHSVVHPRKPADSRTPVTIKDLYGSDIELATFDGTHPMTHANSIPQSKKPLGREPMSPVQQKEGHLVIHWLAERIKGTHKEFECITVRAGPETESTPEKPCAWLVAPPNYKEINSMLAAAENQFSKDGNPLKWRKWELLHRLIMPLLRGRLRSLENLLDPDYENESTLRAREKIKTIIADLSHSGKIIWQEPGGALEYKPSAKSALVQRSDNLFKQAEDVVEHFTRYPNPEVTLGELKECLAIFSGRLTVEAKFEKLPRAGLTFGKSTIATNALELVLKGSSPS